MCVSVAAQCGYPFAICPLSIHFSPPPFHRALFAARYRCALPRAQTEKAKG